MSAISEAVAEAKRQNAISSGDANGIATMEGLIAEVRRKAREEGRKYAEDDRARREEEERVSSALDTLQREYRQQIRSVAEDIAESLRNGDADDAHDAIHEAVDGHSWVIYTHSNFKVLLCSSNHDAYDQLGEVPTQNGLVNWAVLAYYAMSADVNEELERITSAPADDTE